MSGVSDLELSDFCSVTGVTDLDLARQYLTFSDGDLHHALTLYYESGQGFPTSQAINMETEPASEERTVPEEPPVLLDLPEPRMQTDLENQTLHDSSQVLGHQPIGLHSPSETSPNGPGATHDQPYIPPISEIFADDPAFPPTREDGRSKQLPAKSRPQPALHLSRGGGPGPNALERPPRLRAEHGPSTLYARFRKASEKVTMHITLNDARRAAKRKDKFVLVVVFSFTNQPHMAEILNLWDDQPLREVLKAHFVVVQYHADSTPGKDFRAFYPIRTYPHLAILDPRTGERLTHWSKRLGVYALTNQLKQFLNKNSLAGRLEYPTVPPPESGDIDGMSEQEQLEAAIRASLRPYEAPRMGLDESRISDDDADDCEVDVVGDDLVPSAPTLSPQEIIESLPPRDLPDVEPGPASTRIQFRFPDTTRKVKRFPLELPVTSLYQYVKVHVPKGATDLELICIRESLAGKLNLSIAEAGLANSAIIVSFTG
ncbi:UBX domain protein Ubx2 [Massospora cicadina]|nr:UBX domain protein Ubx2 [Massospora cicadina]